MNLLFTARGPLSHYFPSGNRGSHDILVVRATSWASIMGHAKPYKKAKYDDIFTIEIWFDDIYNWNKTNMTNCKVLIFKSPDLKFDSFLVKNTDCKLSFNPTTYSSLTHVCAVSWARIKTVAKPISLLTVKLVPSLPLHMELKSAYPEIGKNIGLQLIWGSLIEIYQPPNETKQ